MRDLPILFSGAMVRALLDGRKTQTRRVIKNQSADDVGPFTVAHYHPTVIDRHREDAPGVEIFGAYSPDGKWGSKCPYGEAGDRPWVREAWRSTKDLDRHSGSRIAELCLAAGYRHPWAPVQYEADGTRTNWERTSAPPHGDEPLPGRYRHARFMPR
jgi:hypothetical protein